MSVSNASYTESMLSLLEYMNQVEAVRPDTKKDIQRPQQQIQSNYQPQIQQQSNYGGHVQQNVINVAQEQPDMNHVVSSFLQQNNLQGKFNGQQPLILQGYDLVNNMGQAQLDPTQLLQLQNTLSMHGIQGNAPLIIFNVGQQQQQAQPQPQQYNQQVYTQDYTYAQEQKPMKRTRQDSNLDPIDTKRTKMNDHSIVRRGSMPQLTELQRMRTPEKPTISREELMSPGTSIDSFLNHREIISTNLFDSTKSASPINVQDEQEDVIRQFMAELPPTPLTSLGHFEAYAFPPTPTKVEQPVASVQNNITLKPPKAPRLNRPVTRGASKKIKEEVAASPIDSDSSSPATPLEDYGALSHRRRASTGSIDSAGTPETPSSDGEWMNNKDFKYLVCLGKKKRKNKKPEPEDQFMQKFSLRS